MTNSLHQIPLDAEILSHTPPEVIELILSLLERIRVLEARVEELEAKLNQNSSNSNKPPSSDPPFVKRPEVAKKSKKPRKRRGMRQQCLCPTKLIELPSIKAKVTHIILYRGHCCTCGKMIKAHIPQALRERVPLIGGIKSYRNVNRHALCSLSLSLSLSLLNSTYSLQLRQFWRSTAKAAFCIFSIIVTGIFFSGARNPISCEHLR